MKNSTDRAYLKKEHHLKMFYDTIALSELLQLNYEYSTDKYCEASLTDVIGIAIRKEKYSQNELEEMVKNALIINKMKYKHTLPTIWQKMDNK